MKVLVYDLGGGTFDVTLIDMKPGEFRTLATDGDVRLGGYDWDMRVLEFAATVFMQQTGADLRQDQGSVYKLMNEVEEAKKTLSARDQAKIRVDHAGHSVVVPITRQQFEEMTADLLNRTAYTTRQLVQTAGLAWNQVNRVLLVGGSTRMPMVPRMLKELTGVIPDHVVHPDEAVARGAALYAAFLLGAQDKAAAPQYSITNVNSHSLGIEGIDLATGRKLNKILIPRNSALPAKVTRKFVTKRAAQPSIVIHVLEGESTIPAACTSVGRAVIRNLPPDIPAGTAIQITYQYETNGRLKVTARIPGIGHETHLEMEREGQLSPQQVGRWRQVLAQNVPINSFEDAVKAELGLTRAS
jgi:molecular chaperone DnaK